jgi:hypothetical protein
MQTGDVWTSGGRPSQETTSSVMAEVRLYQTAPISTGLILAYLGRPDPRLSRPARVGNAPVVLSAAAAVRRISRSDVELRGPDIGMSAELR